MVHREPTASEDDQAHDPAANAKTKGLAPALTYSGNFVINPSSGY